jgi:hypothetical protein
MGVKISGLQFKAFMNDAAVWPDGMMYEDEVIVVDGVPLLEGFDPDAVSDTAQITVTGGYMENQNTREEHGSFEACIKRWMKAQRTIVLMVEVDRDRVGEARAVLKNLNYRVIS